jgi:hypothetical protein
MLKTRRAVQGKPGYGAIYTSVTGYAGRTAPFSLCAICYVIWRLHAAEAAFWIRPLTVMIDSGLNVRSVPEAKKRLAARKSCQPQLTITTILLNSSYFLTECYRPDYKHR